MHGIKGIHWLALLCFFLILYVVVGCSAYKPMTIDTINEGMVELYGTTNPAPPPADYDGTITVDPALLEREGVIYHPDGSRSYFRSH